MKQLILAVLIILWLSNCNNQEKQKADSSDRTELIPEPDKDLREAYEKQELTKPIDSFFKNYHGDFRTVNHHLISPDLAQLIDKAIAKEKLEVSKVAKSDSPSDKPLLIEGDVFTSLYEGQDGYKIDSIKIDGNKATATVKFTNTKFNENWIDKILLVKEERWYIDNVLFKGDRAELPDTKAVLQNFINKK